MLHFIFQKVLIHAWAPTTNLSNDNGSFSSQSFVYDQMNLQIFEIIITMSRVERKINIHIKSLIYCFIR